LLQINGGFFHNDMILMMNLPAYGCLLVITFYETIAPGIPTLISLGHTATSLNSILDQAHA
jgi:hypothetical protein